MAKAERGDFGFPQKKHVKRQVVGIFDLVEFAELDSNKDLVQAVSMLQNELEMSLTPEFFWGDRAVGGREKETNNILLRSTGDGYVVAFSANVKPAKALQHQVDIHRRVHTKHAVRLGVNLGDNYVVADVNGFVNILGWGINLAARALGFAESGQIICTNHFAEPLLEADRGMGSALKKIGVRQVKKNVLTLYNYRVRDEFGAALTAEQEEAEPPDEQSTRPQDSAEPPNDPKAVFLSEIKQRKKFFYGTVVAQAQQVEVDHRRVTFVFTDQQRALAQQIDNGRSWLEAMATRTMGREMTVVARKVAGSGSNDRSSRT